MDTIHLGLIASLITGLATGVGALPVLFTKNISDDVMDILLGFAAGVMLAATAFSLLVPAINQGGAWIAVAGLAVGAVTLHLLDKYIPHFHPVAGAEGPSSRLSRTWLFIVAMTLHNFPEGLAVGVSFGSGNVAAGFTTAMAIGLQNLPEGLAVALPLLREKYSVRKSLGYATLTGLVEPLGGLVGVVIVSMSLAIMPFGLAFAGGAMLFVVIDEMIPESHRKGFGRKATFGFIIGFVLMMPAG